MNVKQIGLIVLTASVGGGIAVNLFEDKEEVSPVYEYQVVPKVYFSPTNGKTVKLVGANSENTTKVAMETEAGRAVPLKPEAGVNNDVLCNVIFVAAGKQEPDVPSLKPSWQQTMPPRMLGETEDKRAIWWAVLQGQGCVEVASLGEDYLGSSMEQLQALNSDVARKLLKTFSRDKDGQKDTVDIDDETADPEADVFFPHEIFGRDDLNFEKAKRGEVVKTYAIPEQGFAALPVEQPKEVRR